MKQVRVRIAPSPTGEDLHIGNVYTALINYIFSKQQKGKFIVRIEDTDRKRLVENSEEKILSSLRWFGLDYDEGPDKGGPYGPYRQSERKHIYQSFANKLVEKGNAYHCYCTPERLEKMRSEQIAKGNPTTYDGYCKTLSNNKIIGSNNKTNSVIRLNVPDEGLTEFQDIIRGKISFDNRLVDDQVLIKSDGFPTYHLAVVVDDYLMKISHVIRAEDWISSTPKHILLYNFFGWKLPLFCHVPLIRNPDKSKLSKRKNPVWVSWYRENGYLPEALLNYLAMMGWSMPDGKDIFTIEELIQKFELKALKAVGPAFDLKKLDWLDGEYIRKTLDKNLGDKLVQFFGKSWNSDVVYKTVPLIKERIKKLSDYRDLAEFFFKSPQKYEIDLKGEKKMVGKMIIKLEKLNEWNENTIGEEMIKLASDEKIPLSKFFMILRVSITGKKISPPLNASMEILGKNTVLFRLKTVIMN